MISIKKFKELNLEMFVYFLDLLYFNEPIFSLDISSSLSPQEASESVIVDINWVSLLLAKRNFPELYNNLLDTEEKKCFVVNKIWKALEWQVKNAIPGSKLPLYLKFLFEKESSMYYASGVLNDCSRKLEVLLNIQERAYTISPVLKHREYFTKEELKSML